MKKLLFLVVVLFVMAGWTLAQTSGTQDNTQTGTNATSTQSTTTQTGNTGQTGTSDQTSTGATTGQTGTAATSDQEGTTSTTGRKGKLPQTASPLPLLGLLGIGSLGAGLVARKRR